MKHSCHLDPFSFIAKRKILLFFFLSFIIIYIIIIFINLYLSELNVILICFSGISLKGGVVPAFTI